jgi:alpha-L-arabinofuranosidase
MAPKEKIAFARQRITPSHCSNRIETDDSSPLGLSVSASQGDGEIVLTFVNPRSDKDLEVDSTLRGASATSGTAQIITNSDWNACNTFQNPDKVVPQSHPVNVTASRIHLDLPRLSVATVTLKTA